MIASAPRRHHDRDGRLDRHGGRAAPDDNGTGTRRTYDADADGRRVAGDGQRAGGHTEIDRHDDRGRQPDDGERARAWPLLPHTGILRPAHNQPTGRCLNLHVQRFGFGFNTTIRVGTAITTSPGFFVSAIRHSPR